MIWAGHSYPARLEAPATDCSRGCHANEMRTNCQNGRWRNMLSRQHLSRNADLRIRTCDDSTFSGPFILTDLSGKPLALARLCSEMPVPIKHDQVMYDS